jgi:hypothetical protein
MHSAHYSLLVMRPDPERVDSVCVGVAVLRDDGQWRFSMLSSLDKLRAINPEFAEDHLQCLGGVLGEVLADSRSMAEAQELLRGIRASAEIHPYKGSFVYETEMDFASEVQAIMRESVAPPSITTVGSGVLQHVRAKPRIKTRLKRQFEHMGILAKTSDEIADHKVVANYPVSLRHGLNAEFALQNSVMHITETVDFDVSHDSIKTKILEAQAKCLIMRTAKETFGDKTKCYVVLSGAAAEHANRSVDLLSTTAELFALESSEDMRTYFDVIGKAAHSTQQIREN